MPDNIKEVDTPTLLRICADSESFDYDRKFLTDSVRQAVDPDGSHTLTMAVVNHQSGRVPPHHRVIVTAALAGGGNVVGHLDISAADWDSIPA